MSITQIDVETGEVTVLQEDAPSFPPSREDWRATASLPKSDFCVALLEAGILTEEQAIEGAGGIWPAPFEPVIAGLPTLDRVRLKADFRAITHIRRAHPLMDGLGAAAGLTPEQIDTLFGWQDV